MNKLHLLTGLALLSGTWSASAVLITDGAIYTSVSASSEYPGFPVFHLFDGTPTVGSSTGLGEQYASVGTGPAYVEFELDQAYVFDALAFAQRVGGDPLADKVGSIDFWFSSGSAFTAADPGVAPAATVSSLDTTPGDNTFFSYSISGSPVGQYVLARLNIAGASIGQPVNNIGGYELRLGGVVAASTSVPDGGSTWSLLALAFASLMSVGLRRAAL